MRRRSKQKAQRASLVNGAGLVLAFACLAFALKTGAPAQLAKGALNSLAAASVSISAGVAPNPDNTAAQELQSKAAELDRQQAALAQQEHLPLAAGSANSLGLYSFIASIVLIALVGLNFYYDWRRERRRAGPSLRLDLRAGR